MFGQVYNQWKNKECVCPNCSRSIAASRFAPHLEKCLGMGRNSSRIANRRYESTAEIPVGVFSVCSFSLYELCFFTRVRCVIVTVLWFLMKPHELSCVSCLHRIVTGNNTNNKSESDQEDNDDVNDNDWSYGAEKKGKNVVLLQTGFYVAMEKCHPHRICYM